MKTERKDSHTHVTNIWSVFHFATRHVQEEKLTPKIADFNPLTLREGVMAKS